LFLLSWPTALLAVWVSCLTLDDHHTPERLNSG
jgi:hypothetical protein